MKPSIPALPGAKDTVSGQIMRKLRNHFLAGLLVLLPITATCWLVWTVYALIGAWGSRIFPPLIRTSLTTIAWAFGLERPETYAEPTATGLYAVMTILGIMVVGILARTYIVSRLLKLLDHLLTAIPAIGDIYTTLRQAVELVLGEGQRTAFRQVVLVDFPRPGCKSLGFLTNSQVTGLGFPSSPEKERQDYAAVFVPTTPNFTTGFLIMVPPEQLHNVDISVEDAFKIILSGGMITPAQLEELEPSHPDLAAPSGADG